MLRLFFALALSLPALSLPEPQLSKGGPRNFGLLVNNSYYQIYRSAALGRSGLHDLEKHLKKEGLPFPKTIIYMNHDGYKKTRLRSKLFALEELEASKDYGFEYFHSFRRDYSTYLDTYDPSNPKKDVNKRKYIDEILPEMQIFGDMDAFYRVLDLVLNSEQPVLFHCTGGHHRTGMVALAIRYLQGGAWREGKYIGPLRRQYLNKAQYEYYKHNTVQFESRNLDFIEAWAQTAAFGEYFRLYSDRLNQE